MTVIVNRRRGLVWLVLLSAGLAVILLPFLLITRAF